jgi:hypothetical protein
MDFDETRLYYSHQQLQVTTEQDADGTAAVAVSDEQDESAVDLSAVRRHFREFLRTYRGDDCEITIGVRQFCIVCRVWTT